MGLTRACGRKWGASRGQGLVEFALIFPVMMLLLMGLFDLGRAVYAYNTIADAARTASRVAIVDQTTSGGVYLAQSRAAEQATALGLAPASVSITFRAYDLSGPCTPLAIGCVAEVTVPYTFSAITPIISNILGTFTMSSTTRLPVERVYAAP
jgi:Flp pilus assembly protein TadG